MIHTALTIAEFFTALLDQIILGALLGFSLLAMAFAAWALLYIVTEKVSGPFSLATVWRRS